MKKPVTVKQVMEIVHGIDGWLSPHESRLLYEIARNVPVSGDVVEIGSWKGKSTVALAYGVKDSGKVRTVAAVDPHEGIVLPGQKQAMESTVRAFQRNIKISGVADTVRPYIMTSKQAAKSWNKPVAVLFIDGIHDYTHAREDFESWIPYVADNGVIAFHDCFCGVFGVTRVAQKLLLHPDTILDVGTVGSILYGIKGKATGVQRIIIRVKIVIITITQYLYNNMNLNKWIQNIFIHKIARMLLLSSYTIRVYL